MLNPNQIKEDLEYLDINFWSEQDSERICEGLFSKCQHPEIEQVEDTCKICLYNKATPQKWIKNGVPTNKSEIYIDLIEILILE